MTSLELYKEALARAAYRALLRREPEEAVLRAQSGERLPEFEAFAADYLREMVESPEFRALSQPSNPEFPPDTWASVTLQDGLKLRVDLGDSHVSRQCMSGVYEPPETAFVDRHVMPGASFVDIGANIGWFALRAARRVTRTGRVVAFEPRVATAENLRLSVAENGFSDWVEVHNLALGDAAGVRHIGSEPSGRHPGATWFLSTDALLQVYRDARKDVQETVVETLDAAIGGAHVDFIKIDVEGAELLIFKGAGETLKASRPVIISEINKPGLERVSQVSVPDYISYFRSIDYDCRRLEDDGAVGARVIAAELPDLDDRVVSVIFTPG
jgi:FkbM family methyltransferase